MGQRLVIEVVKNGRSAGTFYYHWSAYTLSALEEAKSLIEALDEADTKTFPSTQRALIEIARTKKSGLWSEAEAMWISQHFGGTDTNMERDRNEGVLALSKAGQENMRAWAEGSITLDLDHRTVSNDVFDGAYDLDDLNESLEEFGFEKRSEEDIPGISIDIASFDFGEVGKLMGELADCDFLFAYNEGYYRMID